MRGRIRRCSLFENRLKNRFNFCFSNGEFCKYLFLVARRTVCCEPVSDAEMGKIMGKTHKLPQANERNGENPCGTGTSDDSDVQK